MGRPGVRTLTAVIAAALCGAALGAADIGIYYRPSADKTEFVYGHEGIKVALEENGYEERVAYVRELTPEALRGFKVLIVPCVYGYPRAWPEERVREHLRNFVEAGGGVLLTNESVGWRRGMAQRPPFPEIGTAGGKGDPYLDGATSGVGPSTARYVSLTVADKAHPLAAKLPEEIAKVLFDMPDVAPGPQGRAVLTHSGRAAGAVVAGEMGRGRVVLAAPALGLGPRFMETPPSGAQLQLLLNCVRWLGRE